MSDRDSVLIVAAESSSALYARRLIEHWQKSNKKLDCYGIGDEHMVRLGFRAMGRAESMAVVGFSEVIKHYGAIRKVFFELLAEVKKNPPRFALLLDYPGFNLRLAKELKKLGVTVVYYISPQLWAWKKGRIKDVKKYVDRMFVVFPFEVDFYRENGFEAEFVGHPLLDEIEAKFLDLKYRQMRRARYGIGENDLVLGLMPGSRRSELDHHFTTQLQTAEKLMQQHRQLRSLILVAPNLEKSELQQRMNQSSAPFTVVKDDPFEMVYLCDVVLCASGTATLLVGLMRVPMVIMYKMSSISAWLARRLVTGTRFFGMVNLILDKMLCPEFFQEQASVDVLSKTLSNWVSHPAEREVIAQELGSLKSKLGEQGVTERVAQKLSSYFSEQ